MPGLHKRRKLQHGAGDWKGIGQWHTLEEVFVYKGTWQRTINTDVAIQLKHLTSQPPFSTTVQLNPGTHVITLPEGFNKIEVLPASNGIIFWER